MDEFHYIKNRRAQRTKYAKEIAKRVPGLLLLSGTPLLSRPEELFNGLNLLDGLTWNNWFNFTKKFCGGHFGRFGYETKGATNIEELREKISPYFLRRTKEEVLPDLPPKRYIDLPVKLDDKTREKYTIAKNNFVKYLRETKKKTNEEIMKSLFAETLVKLNELRMITSEGKIEYAKEVINNILDGGEKVVVFSVYNQPLEQLKETFGESAVLLTGNTEQKERARVIEEFQNNPNKKIFLGGIKSAGIGITLTAASNVLFCDYSWVPADHAQAMDRTHRIGQKADSITIYQLYAKDTIDHNMKNLLEKKQSIFDKIVGGDDSEIKKEHSMISDITNIMRQEYEE